MSGKRIKGNGPLQRNLIKALAFAGTYKKPLLFAAGAVVVVGLVFAGVFTSFKRSENNASDLIAKAMSEYRTQAEDPNAAYLAVKEDFQTVFTEYGNTDAGRMALVQFAGICMEAGQYDDTQKWLEKAYDVFGDRPELRNFLLSSLGHVQLAQDNLDQAESYFVQIETGSSSLLKDEARFYWQKFMRPVRKGPRQRRCTN